MDGILQSLGCEKLISILDLRRGYWQLKMHPEVSADAVFITPFGLYQFRYMPFGLKRTPATLQRLVDCILKSLPYTRAYLEDIIVFSNSFNEHITHTKKVLTRLRKAGLTLNVEKCKSVQSENEYRGHKIGNDIITPLREKKEKIRNAAVPNTKKVRSFLGLVVCYQRFIPNFATITKPLSEVTKKGFLAHIK